MRISLKLWPALQRGLAIASAEFIAFRAPSWAAACQAAGSGRVRCICVVCDASVVVVSRLSFDGDGDYISLGEPEGLKLVNFTSYSITLDTSFKDKTFEEA